MPKHQSNHTKQLLGEIEHHRDVERARKESSAADPEELHCTNGIRLSMSQLIQFLKKQIALTCGIWGTVYCGRPWEFPWPEHTVLPSMGSPSLGGVRAPGRWWAELPGSKRTDSRGLRNATVSSRSAEASARVNSPRYTPRAAFACPEELYEDLTPFMETKEKARDSRPLQRIV